MRVLMVGVDAQTKGGMWTVAENYLKSEAFVRQTGLEYVATSITGSIPKRILFTAKALLKIITKLRTGKFDIVHIHMAERGSVYRKNIVIDMAKLFRCKVVLHMHGAEFEEWYKSLTADKRARVRKILDKADKVFILGQYWLDFISGLVTHKDRVCVLHNAVFVPAENYYNPNAVNLLFLGVVGQRKGIFDLLQALQLADAHLPRDVRLMIYGPQKDTDIEAEIRKRSLSHRVAYQGWLTADKTPEVFDSTALNILPSYNEGLPMTILETMAYGIPNISTNVAAIPEAVDAENGAVVEPGDAKHLAETIVNLMNEISARRQKSQCAYERAKKDFSIDVHMEKVMDIYRELEQK